MGETSVMAVSPQSRRKVVMIETIAIRIGRNAIRDANT